MIEDLSDDPAGVIREILAGGPLPAAEFRRQAYERGVPYKTMLRVTKEIGVQPRRIGRPGRRGEGEWIWELTRPEDFGIRTIPGRKGYYAKFLFHGREIQNKLADDLETAKIRVGELRRQLEEEWALKAPSPKSASPAESRTALKARKPLHLELRDLARQCLGRNHSDIARKLIRLSRKAIELEKKGTGQCTP